MQPESAWDNDLFGCPIVAGYAPARAPITRRGEPIDGASRFRRILEADITDFQITVAQTAAQYHAFLAWYEDVLDYGGAWFSIDLMFGTEIEEFIAHIRGGLEWSDLNIQASFGEMSFALECLNYSSTPFVVAAPVFIDAGTTLNPSPVTELVDAGTATAPSPDSDLIWGGDDVGQVF